MIIAIPDDYHGVVPTLDCFQRLEGHDVRVFRDAAPPFDAIVEQPSRRRDHRADTRAHAFTRELIEALPRLKMISQTGRSTHHIDVAACTERGIAVAAGTHASPYTVAEHTWALIFAALRHIPEEAALMKRGEWRQHIQPRPAEAGRSACSVSARSAGSSPQPAPASACACSYGAAKRSREAALRGGLCAG